MATTEKDLEARLARLEQLVNDLIRTVMELRAKDGNCATTQYRDHWGNWLPPGEVPRKEVTSWDADMYKVHPDQVTYTLEGN